VPHRSSLSLSQEKRRHPRLQHNIPLKISGDNGDILTETQNLSCSGAFCRVSQRLEPMTRLKVYLLLPLRKSNKVTTKKIICQGVVVRVAASEDAEFYDMAIFFSDITPKDSRTINEFIESMMEKKDYGKFN
jgi:PilZ domain